ncbi:MAG: histidine kinase dimerization/phosphoacceptor domain-containing protein [Propionibacteriaceae bacterium]|nr:histidine kinase dimerization/phosphoacceptor domain-containing protein [Propionibacteriaceae bacterium]
MVALLVGTVALMQVSSDFVWLVFQVWMWVAHVVRLPVALTLTAASVAMVTLHQQGQSSSAAVLGPIIVALIAVGLARGALRLEREGETHRRLLTRVIESQAEGRGLVRELVGSQRDAAMLAERTRLSHDIHDTLVQGFSSILLLSRAAARETDPTRVHGLLAQLQQAASQNLTESRPPKRWPCSVQPKAPSRRCAATQARRP